MKNRLGCFTIIFLLISFLGISQDGSPDTTFGTNGIVETDIEGGFEIVNDVAQSESGRILVVGNTIDMEDLQKNFVVAYLENGDLDTSFGNNGILLDENIALEFTDVFVQSDEKIIVGSGYGQYYTLLKFLEDGSEDLNFGSDGELIPFSSGGFFRDLFILEDDTFLVSGTISGQATLKKYLSNGTIDTSFGTNGISNFSPNSVTGKIQVMENDKIILTNSSTVLRCLSNGALDTSFGTNGIAIIPTINEESSCSSLVFSNGGILVNCSYFDNDLEETVNYILKLSSDEAIQDLSFGIDGILYGNMAEIIQSNQRILMKNLTDWIGDTTLHVKRYLPNGNLDASFNYISNYGLLLSYEMNLQKNGKLLIAGSSTLEDTITPDIVLQQYNNNPLGIEDQKNQKLTVYPNPSNGIFNISHDFITSETPYQVSDIIGKTIQQGTISGEQAQIDISQAQKGVYLFTILNITYRLIKH